MLAPSLRARVVMEKPAFRRRLLGWYRIHRRDLPWRRTRDPYAVWISETMLQQTRVAVVVPYYERFLRELPTLASLATAAEDRVLALWSGLGYYSRARNLRRAARQALERHEGRLPEDSDALSALPGIGRYTLGALLSIAFDRPWPVVDGNVARVLSRVFALAGDPRQPSHRERLWEIAGSLVSGRSPGDFNQALMELGAEVCLPRIPRCSECPVRSCCAAYAEGGPEAYPRPRQKKKAEIVPATALVLESKRGVWLERKASGVNRGLYDVPAPAESLAPRAGRRRVGRFRHGILSRVYEVTLYRARVEKSPRSREGKWVLRSQLGELPLTARARKAIALLDK